MQSAHFTRIPRVPGVYSLAYHGSLYRDFGLLENAEDGGLYYSRIGCNLDPMYSLDYCLEILRDVYKTKYSGEETYDPPVIIAGKEHGSSESYVLTMLAPSLFVAYSEFFVVVYDSEHGKWFLEWIAKDPGNYFKVRVPGGKKVIVTLDWDGKGLVDVKTVQKEDIAVANRGANQNLLRHRYSEDNNNLSALWLGGFSGSVYCSSTGHTFRLVRNEGRDCIWEVYHCGSESFLTDCHLSGLELSLENVPWQMLVKDNEQAASDIEEPENSQEEMRESSDTDDGLSLCDIFGF